MFVGSWRSICCLFIHFLLHPSDGTMREGAGAFPKEENHNNNTTAVTSASVTRVHNRSSRSHIRRGVKLAVAGTHFLTTTSWLANEAAGISAAQRQPYQQINLDKEIVCQNIKVINSVDSFRSLENCTVIEGYLMITLIDHPEFSSVTYDQLSFPNLREITEYMIIWRVTGLKTLRNLFPNLSTIRGRAPAAQKYALFVYENPDLEELGLVSLTHVEQYGIFVQKNSLLCYVDTINWDLIKSPASSFKNHIRRNKPERQCANQCPSSCAFFRGNRRMCWTSADCQMALTTTCDERGPQTDCCNRHCLTGCYGGNRNECLVCRQVHYRGACMPKCPEYTFMLEGRRCLNEEECQQHRDQQAPDTAFKAYNGECGPECPAGTVEDTRNRHKCVPCGGNCPKVCVFTSKIISAVQTARELSGCTVVNGSLEINIMNGPENAARMLEDYLQYIEEVTEYVKIMQTPTVISLGFLRRLKVIHGEKLATGNYALQVIDNQNLQDLLHWTGPRKSLKIMNPKGKVNFHYSPRLCLSKIDELVSRVEGSQPGWKLTPDSHDISQTSNGDRIACQVTHLNLEIRGMTADVVLLDWDAFNLEDSRNLLGYFLLYREASHRNVTKFEGMDKTSWTQIFVPVHTDIQTKVSHWLMGLTAAKQYAVYVTAWTVSTERHGAQSDIIYFTALPQRPTAPRSILTLATSASSIEVHWLPPSSPNGEVAYYTVRWHPQPDAHEGVRERNYCDNRIAAPVKDEFVVAATVAPNRDKCPCTNRTDDDEEDSNRPVPVDEDEQREAIAAENALQDLVYVKSSRVRRAAVVNVSSDSTQTTRASFVDAATTALLSANVTASPNPANSTRNASRTVLPPFIRQSKRVSSNERTAILTGLDHFTGYVITVEACHDRPVDGHASPHVYKACSEEQKADPVQTLARKGADDISSESVHVELNDTDKRLVHVGWQDPKRPNGIVVTVDIFYQLADVSDTREHKECVPRTQIDKLNHTFDVSTLPAGNYSFRLQASSFAGNGSLTEPQYIYIEPPPVAGKVGFSTETVIGIVLGILLPVALILAIAGYYYRKAWKQVPLNAAVVSVNPDYYVYEPDEWEVQRENVELGRELGAGSFGKVFEATAKNIILGVDRLLVAVKTINETTSPFERNLFLQEASVMKSFRGAAHVVNLLGVVSEGQPALVIMELMTNGDLRSWLRAQRPDDEEPNRPPPAFSRVLQMSGEICDGMAYIHSKKFVHRDLAARNCMVAEDMTVKIGDFGMSRDIYETDYYRKGGKGMLPVRWMAPESLKDGLFNNPSDVWSFGVVLWEIATLAAQPYQGLSNEDVLHHVIARGLMQKPEGCPDRLYALMLRCWQYKAQDRPTFLQIVEEMLPDLSENFHEICYYKKAKAEQAVQRTKHDSNNSVNVDGEQEMVDMSPKFVSPLTDIFQIHYDEEEVVEQQQRREAEESFHLLPPNSDINPSQHDGMSLSSQHFFDRVESPRATSTTSDDDNNSKSHQINFAPQDSIDKDQMSASMQNGAMLPKAIY